MGPGFTPFEDFNFMRRDVRSSKLIYDLVQFYPKEEARYLWTNQISLLVDQ